MNVRLRMVNTLSSSAVQFESFAKGHEFPGPPAKVYVAGVGLLVPQEQQK
jgi:hypothetical protein